MASNVRMSKVPEWPRPHNFRGSIGFSVEPSTAKQATIIPIAYYDEGLGIINSYKSCPQNANFAEYSGAANYPTSRINSVNASFTFSMTKEAIETDKIPIIRFYTATIHCAFNETGLALDEKSTLDLNEILELQVQTDDRLMTPLFNAIDMTDGKTNALLDAPADQESLDTDLEMEGVALETTKIFDCLHYYTNGNKLRSVFSGLQEHTLTRYKPKVTIHVKQQSNTKYMNPYAFLGLLAFVPKNLDVLQYGKVGDTTADALHVQLDYFYRYNEHNHEFNHSLQ